MASVRSEGEIVLVRHGETEWSRTGRHTGRTDLPLTDEGRRQARRLAPLLAARDFALVLSSPLQRARQTAELAGLGRHLQIEPDLVEWSYGEFEGLTSDEIEAEVPGWSLFSDGCPGGESPEQVGERVDRVLARLRPVVHDDPPRAVVFAHGHVLRVLAARWIGLPPAGGRHLLLATSTLSVLGHYRGSPALERWNAPVGGGLV